MKNTSIMLGILCFFVAQIIIGSLLFFISSLWQTRDGLIQITQRVKEDITYRDGKWDTSQYNADSTVPSVNPLYIITSDGFVIDRWRPIHGLLDASEFTRILTYTTPQTINTVTNENWRVLSAPIVSSNEIVGVVLVTAYRPDPATVQSIDTELAQTIEDIQKTLSVQGQTVNVSRLDPRKLPFTITYQIVNKFNKVIAQSDNVNSITRTPTFIDASYVDNQLKSPRLTQVTDSITQKPYLVQTSPLYNNNHEVVGIIVAGAPIDSFYHDLFNHVFFFGSISLLLLLLSMPLLQRLWDKQLQNEVSRAVEKKNPTSIAFLKKKSTLLIDKKAIEIPYASYQYYFCDALFSKPQKRWEVDELLERFGEQFEKTSWRKVYDTMVALNKKVEDILPSKLFIVKDKTYQLNPHFFNAITQEK